LTRCSCTRFALGLAVAETVAGGDDARPDLLASGGSGHVCPGSP
jgi:hypothetical protein